jgi:hypothetical protein
MDLSVQQNEQVMAFALTMEGCRAALQLEWIVVVWG